MFLYCDDGSRGTSTIFVELPLFTGEQPRQCWQFGGSSRRQKSIGVGGDSLSLRNIFWMFFSSLGFFKNGRNVQSYKCFFIELTPQKINMEPDKTPLEEEYHSPNHHDFHVELQGCKSGEEALILELWGIESPGEVFPSFRADCRIEEMFPICWPDIFWQIQGGRLSWFQSFFSVHVLPWFFC